MTDNKESNKLGLWTSTSLVVGNMIGSGVFLMPAAMAAFGTIGLLGWLFSAIGSFFLAKVFSNLSKLVPNKTGGPYVYTRAGFGDFTGFLVAWGYWIANCGANAAIVISFISAMSVFFPAWLQIRWRLSLLDWLHLDNYRDQLLRRSTIWQVSVGYNYFEIATPGAHIRRWVILYQDPKFSPFQFKRGRQFFQR